MFQLYIQYLPRSFQFSVYNTGCYVYNVCTSIFLYADDIVLLAPSVSSLQKLLSACEEELYFLDMRINDKKSVCIRFGNRHDVCCAPVTTCSAWRSATMGRYVQISGYLFCQCSVVQMYF